MIKNCYKWPEGKEQGARKWNTFGLGKSREIKSERETSSLKKGIHLFMDISTPSVEL